MLKLPKDVLADPRHDALVALLEAHTAPLWDSGKHPVPTLPMNAALAAELGHALDAGLACQGLEKIGDTLAAEQKGLDALKAKTPESPQNARASRILFLASDGSTRFYRDADALLSRYAQRVLAVRLDLAGEALGEALLGEVRLVRAVLVFDKKAAARALLALLPAG
jgi:hypothetical protein